MASRPFHVLLVEDNDAHARLATLAMERSPVDVSVDRVADGAEALAYLQYQPPHETHPPVNLVLLDLNAPRLSGIEVLRQAKTDPRLRAIPIVVLSASMSRTEAEEAYLNYANSYLVKPVDYNDFQAMVNDLLLYWATWNQGA